MTDPADSVELDTSEVLHIDEPYDRDEPEVRQDNLLARKINREIHRSWASPPKRLGSSRQEIPLFDEVYFPVVRGNDVWLVSSYTKGKEIYLGQVGDRRSAQFLIDSSELLDKLEEFNQSVAPMLTNYSSK